MKKVAILISGGVDSSVALCLLKKWGYDVRAFYLKFWLEDEVSYLNDCPWKEDLEYVQAVCAVHQVPLEIMPIQKEYWDRVVTYTVNEVKAGRTPNPDMLCNQRIKFGYFLEKYAAAFDKVATGHYAQLIEQDGVCFLKQSPDKIKDQTYFLAYLNQAQLQKCLFPIGHLNKKEVRNLAASFDLPNKDRKDSQGICFLGKFKFEDFLKYHVGEKIGDLIEYESGKKVGEHYGFWFFTIGQRKNIRLSDGPWYVVSKKPEENVVYVSKSYHGPDKLRDSFKVRDLNWFSGRMPLQKNLKVKLRHGPGMYECTLNSASSDTVAVKIIGNDQGIATGQFAVFYEGDICLGGGVIRGKEAGPGHSSLPL